jgi:hypothetical protein
MRKEESGTSWSSSERAARGHAAWKPVRAAMIPEIQGDGERVNSMLLATSSCVEQVLAERAGDDCRRGGSDARARPVAAGVGWLAAVPQISKPSGSGGCRLDRHNPSRSPPARVYREPGVVRPRVVRSLLRGRCRMGLRRAPS